MIIDLTYYLHVILDNCALQCNLSDFSRKLLIKPGISVKINVCI